MLPKRKKFHALCQYLRVRLGVLGELIIIMTLMVSGLGVALAGFKLSAWLLQ